MVLFSAAALGADTDNTGMPWSLIATGLVGMVVALVGAYAKGLERRVAANELGVSSCLSNTTALREMVLSNYHNDKEIERLFGPVTLQLSDLNKRQMAHEILLMAVHNRLDQAGIGVRPRAVVPDDGN
jgi:hypothetical protein